MTLDEILANKELFILRKKTDIHKSSFENWVGDVAEKAMSKDDVVEVLVYEGNVSKKRNPFMFDQYKNGYVLNHSTGMRYVKLFFCAKTDNPSFIEEKENWDKYYPMILNKEVADVRGYFTAVVEARSIEGSAVVKGSNSLTPVMSVVDIDENTIRVKLAISPSNIIDSHMDVHIPGLWKKTIKENPYDLLLQEHDMSFDKVISDSISDDLKVYTETMTIKELTTRFKKVKKNEPGETTQKEEPSEDTQKVKKSFSIYDFN